MTHAVTRGHAGPRGARPGSRFRWARRPHDGGHQLRGGRLERRRRRGALPVRRAPAPRPGSRCVDYDAGVWHGFVPGVGPGRPTATGSRAYDPAAGLRCNPAKLLLDPYARAITGTVALRARGARLRRRRPGRAERPGLGRRTCRAAWSSTPTYDWSDDARPSRRYADTVIYEVHVKGFTMRHPGVPPELRGTYAGLGHEAAIAHLVDLGVTAVELLPVHAERPRGVPVDRGLTNYWGYNTIGFFAPHQAYSAAGAGRAARGPGRRVQGHGRRPARRRARGHPRRRLQPHRRGQRARARRCASAASTTRPTTAWTRRPAPLRRHHRLRQLAQRRRPA